MEHTLGEMLFFLLCQTRLMFVLSVGIQWKSVMDKLGSIIVIVASIAIINMPDLFVQSKPLQIEQPVAAFTSDDIIQRTNRYRQDLSLNSLSPNKELTDAALYRAQDMAKTGQFSHKVATTTNMTDAWAFMKDKGYNYSDAAENLATWYDNPDSVMQGWIDSPSHKKNLQDKRYTDIGVAVVPAKFGGKDTYFVVQFLGNRKKDGTMETKEVITPVPSKPIAPTADSPKKTALKVKQPLFSAMEGKTAHSTPSIFNKALMK